MLINSIALILKRRNHIWYLSYSFLEFFIFVLWLNRLFIIEYLSILKRLRICRPLAPGPPKLLAGSSLVHHHLKWEVFLVEFWGENQLRLHWGDLLLGRLFLWRDLFLGRGLIRSLIRCLLLGWCLLVGWHFEWGKKVFVNLHCVAVLLLHFTCLKPEWVFGGAINVLDG